MDRKYVTGRALGVEDGQNARARGRRGFLAVDPITGKSYDLARGAQPLLYGTGAQAVPANGQAVVNVRFNTRKACLISSFRGFEATAGAISVQITDERLGRDLQSRACLLSLITGDAQRPYVLPCPILAAPDRQGVGSVFRVVLTNSTGGIVVAHFAFEVLELQQPGVLDPVARGLESEQVFFYSQQLALAAGAGTGTGQALINLQSDGAFELHDLQASPRTAFDISWQSLGTRENFVNQPVRSNDVFGDGQLPGTFVAPQLYQRGDTIQFNGLNQQAGAQTIEIVAAGVKVLS